MTRFRAEDSRLNLRSGTRFISLYLIPSVCQCTMRIGQEYALLVTSSNVLVSWPAPCEAVRVNAAEISYRGICCLHCGGRVVRAGTPTMAFAQILEEHLGGTRSSRTSRTNKLTSPRDCYES